MRPPTATIHEISGLKKDGSPCANCDFLIEDLNADSAEKEILKTDRNGRVIVPSAYIGRTVQCRIENGGEVIANYVSPGHRRGITTLDFVSGNTLKREYRYRFLAYAREEKSEATFIDED